MSQSPVDSGNLGNIGPYRQGWKALNRLLHENKSFSGRETNNAFLNCGDGGRFADVSTAIGWDFEDDARAIGLIDYDHDGDLDLWVSNRTAPRLRLLRNNLDSDANFVSFLLAGNGTTTNRDGIGSRVEVFLKGNDVPLMRTLHAGQSFLSQSSRWLHFGLGTEATIEKVVVHWSGESAETFEGVAVDGFFHLAQGRGQATRREKSPDVKWQAGEAELPPKTSIARTIPPAGHTLPPLETQSGTLIEPTGTSLISLWSRTCPHCQKELVEWGRESAQWHASEVAVIAFSTDQEPRTECDAFLKSVGANFTAEMASPEAVELLDALQSSLLDLWVPIPVPSSFLVTKEGEILAVYRGPVSREQVLADAKLATATPEERRTSGSPFRGRWVGDPTPATSQRAAEQLVQRAQPVAAIDYLKTALSKPFVKGSKFDRADNLLLLGQLLGQQGRPTEAVPPLREAKELVPGDVRILRLLATGLAETGELAEAQDVLSDAIERHPKNADLYQDALRLALVREDPSQALSYARKAVELLPDDPNLRSTMIGLLLQSGKATEAIENCKTILRAQPSFLPAANQLSQILSTHPDEKIRNSGEARALAERLCQITKNRDAGHLFALTLAMANQGEFPEAAQVLKRIEAAIPADTELGKEVRKALITVESGRPVRNDSWQKTASGN